MPPDPQPPVIDIAHHHKRITECAEQLNAATVAAHAAGLEVILGVTYMTPRIASLPPDYVRVRVVKVAQPVVFGGSK